MCFPGTKFLFKFCCTYCFIHWHPVIFKSWLCRLNYFHSKIRTRVQVSALLYHMQCPWKSITQHWCLNYSGFMNGLIEDNQNCNSVSQEKYTDMKLTTVTRGSLAEVTRSKTYSHYPHIWQLIRCIYTIVMLLCLFIGLPNRWWQNLRSRSIMKERRKK